MEYKKMENEIYLRIDPGEDVMETIKNVCERENFFTAYFQGIGACGNVILSTYCPETKKFIEHPYTGMLEMVSLMGNITKNSVAEPSLHAHAVFSYLKDNNEVQTIAGHMLKAVISYTGEIIIRPASAIIGHRTDIVPEINVWNF
jgi:predicted DNA-binding protein with PD1-like motif